MSQAVQFLPMVNPYSMEIREWADQFIMSTSNLGNIPELSDPNLWEDWAAQVVNNSLLSQFNLPRPVHYGDWRKWAIDVVQSLGTTGAG